MLSMRGVSVVDRPTDTSDTWDDGNGAATAQQDRPDSGSTNVEPTERLIFTVESPTGEVIRVEKLDEKEDQPHELTWDDRKALAEALARKEVDMVEGLLDEI